MFSKPALINNIYDDTIVLPRYEIWVSIYWYEASLSATQLNVKVTI